jgi:hypothetical protein
VVCAGVWVRLVGGGSWSEPAPAGPGREAASIERERWSALLRALEDEVEARKELASEVAELRDALAEVGLFSEPDPSADFGADSSEVPPDVDDEAGEVAAPLAGPRPGFDAEALVAAGLDTARAAALRERWEEHELEKLYLRDQAAREGWMMSPRHRREQNDLAARLRYEIGDEDYAALLYATGRPNSVVVTDVLESSPARDAGLEPGDEILRYASERLFRPNELRLATASGEPGEFVSLEVMRDGRIVTLHVRRGPLGVLLRTASRAPQP